MLPSSNNCKIIGKPPASQTNFPILFNIAKLSYLLFEWEGSFEANCDKIDGTIIILWTALTSSRFCKIVDYSEL